MLEDFLPAGILNGGEPGCRPPRSWPARLPPDGFRIMQLRSGRETTTPFVLGKHHVSRRIVDRPGIARYARCVWRGRRRACECLDEWRRPCHAFLLKAHADPNARGAFGTPALHWRVHVDDLAEAKRLLKAGADPNGLTERGLSPLSIAINNGNAEMVRLLLGAGADASHVEPTGETHLMMAAQVGVLSIVEQLLKRGVQVDVRDPNYGQTALMYCRARRPCGRGVRAARARRESQRRNERGPHPRLHQAELGARFRLRRRHFARGVPADRGRREPTPGGMTPLLYAARHNQLEVAKRLVEAGADVNAKEANGIWPLLMAISNNNMAVAHYLLEHGSSVNGQDWYGRSPLWEAVNVRNLYVHNATFKNGIDRAPVLELIRALLAAGADVNARTKETPPSGISCWKSPARWSGWTSPAKRPSSRLRSPATSP